MIYRGYIPLLVALFLICHQYIVFSSVPLSHNDGLTFDHHSGHHGLKQLHEYPIGHGLPTRHILDPKLLLQTQDTSKYTIVEDDTLVQQQVDEQLTEQLVDEQQSIDNAEEDEPVSTEPPAPVSYMTSIENYITDNRGSIISTLMCGVVIYVYMNLFKVGEVVSKAVEIASESKKETMDLFMKFPLEKSDNNNTANTAVDTSAPIITQTDAFKSNTSIPITISSHTNQSIIPPAKKPCKSFLARLLTDCSS